MPLSKNWNAMHETLGIISLFVYNNNNDNDNKTHNSITVVLFYYLHRCADGFRLHL